MVRPDPDNAEHIDNWYVVEDRRQRKRIQDRLAQRARRKRLADSRKVSSRQDNVGTDNTGRLTDTLSREADTTLGCRSPEALSIPTSASLGNDATSSGRPLEVELPMNVWSALFINGSMMGLNCSTSYPAKSRPVGSDIPEALQPTPLQLMTIHPMWIDRFPFPGMRDNLINAISIVEEEDFLRDLFCMASFDIKRGEQPWDPSAWIIRKEFSTKWGFLFTENLA